MGQFEDELIYHEIEEGHELEFEHLAMGLISNGNASLVETDASGVFVSVAKQNLVEASNIVETGRNSWKSPQQQRKKYFTAKKAIASQRKPFRRP